MGAEGWAAYSPSSTSTSTQASRSATRTVNYTYDDLHRLTSEVLGGSEETGTVAYALDDVGNRLGRTSSVSGITPQSLSYSANDWLNSHQYDANGNTLRSDLTSGSVARDAYDFKNRLSQRRIYDASGTVLQKIVDLRYDGDGSLKWKRVTDTTTGEETIRYFVVDHHNLTGYSQIVEELDATGAVVATYHYGHDLISQSRLVVDETTGSSDWVDRLFVYDGGGNVRALTDLEGNITDTFSYDAYGNLLGYSLSAIGSLPTAYFYRGERYDPDLGQYYLRARFYDANLGRFHTLDEYEGRTGEPLSLHKYLYAHASPVSGLDPSGRMFLSAVMTVVHLVSANYFPSRSYRKIIPCDQLSPWNQKGVELGVCYWYPWRVTTPKLTPTGETLPEGIQNCILKHEQQHYNTGRTLGPIERGRFCNRAKDEIVAYGISISCAQSGLTNASCGGREYSHWKCFLESSQRSLKDWNDRHQRNCT